MGTVAVQEAGFGVKPGEPLQDFAAIDTNPAQMAAGAVGGIKGDGQR